MDPPPPLPSVLIVESSPIEGVGVAWGTGIPNSEATSESASNSLSTASKVGSTSVGGIANSASSSYNWINQDKVLSRPLHFRVIPTHIFEVQLQGFGQ